MFNFYRLGKHFKPFHALQNLNRIKKHTWKIYLSSIQIVYFKMISSYLFKKHFYLLVRLLFFFLVYYVYQHNYLFVLSLALMWECHNNKIIWQIFFFSRKVTTFWNCWKGQILNNWKKIKFWHFLSWLKKLEGACWWNASQPFVNE